MKYVVAVSGGIDSVVLLDTLFKENEHELIVAHFDHGIRDDSAADARFVEALAAQYGLPYVGRREELGKDASEEFARARRHLFLGEEGARREAKVVTAHHKGDVVETIAINLTRGTGWRGLAVLGGKRIERPLLKYTKQEIRQYALEKRLEWVEDSTNARDIYLRNRLRFRMYKHLGNEAREKVIQLWKRQLDLRGEIEEEAALFTSTGHFSRHFMTQIDEKVAVELLRNYSEGYYGQSPTRPQLNRALLAIKTARPGTSFPLGRGVLRIDKRDFSLSVKDL